MSTAIKDAFEEFHQANPHVLEHLERISAEWFRAGHNRLGIGMLWEVLRWRIGVQTVSGDFRLNNNFRSRYVRLMLQRHPEWTGRFQTRALRSA